MLPSDLASFMPLPCSSSRRPHHYGGTHHQPESRRPPQPDLPRRQRQASCLHHLDAERRSYQWSHLLQGEAGRGGDVHCALPCFGKGLGSFSEPQNSRGCAFSTKAASHPTSPRATSNSQEDVTEIGSAWNLAGFLCPHIASELPGISPQDPTWVSCS